MRKFIFLALVIVSLSLNFALAESIEENAISQVVVPDFNKPAEFVVSVSGVDEGTYNVYSLTDVSLKPTSNFALGAGRNEFKVFVYPTENLDERGFYNFGYVLNNVDSSKKDYNSQLSVKIVDLEDFVEIDSDVIDSDSSEIEFYVKNNEDVSLEGLDVEFESLLFDVEKEIDLEPFEKTYVSVEVDSEKLKKTKAGTYVVTGKFDVADGVKEIEGFLNIGVKKGIVTQEDSSGFLIFTDSVTKINAGNVDEIVEVEMKKNIVSRLFNSFNVQPDFVEREGFVVYYSWSETLSPGENFVVKSKTNYLFPLLILVFAVAVVFGFIRFIKTKVDVSKSVTPIKTKGGEFALRVKVFIKARKNVENVSIIDKIPQVVKVYKKFGTIKPDKIDTANRRIQWNIGDLDVGEERVVSYVVYSKVGVVGKFSLPEALVVFEEDGEIHEVESSKVYFLAEQTKKDD